MKNVSPRIFHKSLLTGMSLFLAIILSGGILAQELTPAVVGSSGNTFTSSGLSIDFTVGEITTKSLTTANYLLTQGFIQGADPNTGIGEDLIKESSLVVYPNPATMLLNLHLQHAQRNPVNAIIRDLQGRIVLQSDFTQNSLLINLEKLTTGFYTLTVVLDNQQIINKKFIKQ